MDVRTIINAFLANKSLKSRVDVEEMVDKVVVNKYMLARQYGINIEEKGNSGVITSYPVL